MTDIGRGNRGGFAVGKLRAVVAAMALLAASPTIASVADSHLDGSWLAAAEAVFGEPASAQTVDPCYGEAHVDYLQCLDNLPWYLEHLCSAALALDLLICAVTK